METLAYFEDIDQVIKKELKHSKESIKVAVAWFTDHALFSTLLAKAEEGIEVELVYLDDGINQNSGIQFHRLKDYQGKLWQIKNDGMGSLMHNKFCVIDASIIICGSYNWTNKAKTNHESITLIRDNYELVHQFEVEFNNIKSRYFREANPEVEDQQSLLQKLLIRLDALKSVIMLNDHEDIEYQQRKLKSLNQKVLSQKVKKTVTSITELVNEKDFIHALELIKEFSASYQAVQLFNDPEVFAIKLEIESLRFQVASLEDEIQEVERLLYRFEVMHSKILGALIKEILELRESRLRREAEENPEKTQDYEEAKSDREEYNKDYESTKDAVVQELTEQENQDIKKAYRQASKLCHPDIVSEDQQQEAQSVFVDLKNAYDQNDLNKVNQILTDLQKGIFSAKGELISEKGKLISTLEELRRAREHKEAQLVSIKGDKTYQKIITIENWAEYFEVQKQQYKVILEEEKKLVE